MSLRVVMAVALLAQPVLVGCLDAGQAERPWYKPPPEDAFEPWPGLEFVNATPPENAWLREYFHDRMHEPYEEGDALTLNFQAANRLWWQNASAWMFSDVDTIHWMEVKDRFEEEGFDQQALLALWNRTDEQYGDAWDEVNVTGLSVLAAPLDKWYYEQRVGPDQLVEKGDASSAASLATSAMIVQDIVENATSMPGEPVADVTYEDVEPLVGLVGDIDGYESGNPSFATPYENDMPEMAVARVFDVHHFSHEREWFLASVMSATISLIVHEVLHMTYHDEIVTPEEARDTLRSLSENASSPVHEYPAQFAWRAATLANDDPRYMLSIVATDRVWPVIEEVTGLLEDGEDADWESTLDPLVERWEAGWMAAMAEDQNT